MGVTMVNDVAPGDKIIADRTQLYRALFNIVRNAVEAMAPDTSGDVSDDEIGAVAISSASEKGAYVIRIADTGGGIILDASSATALSFHGPRRSA